MASESLLKIMYNLEKIKMYNIDFSRKAQKNLDKLSDSIANPILVAIENLAENPMPMVIKN
jgi:mRNA-degrading endonuclease RelE of RelBE toxin-antitoxin system